MAILKSHKRKTSGSRLVSAANQILNRTSNDAVKGFEKTAKWMATDHINSREASNLIEAMQRVNYWHAYIRRIDRRQQVHLKVIRQIDSGKIPTRFDDLMRWLVDHLLFILDVLWGYINPMLMFVLRTLLSIVLGIIFTAILIYVLFKLLFS